MMMTKMTHASLFSGIGGAELAARWVGWKNVFHCEINPFGRRVIEYHFPESKSYEDVTTTDFSEYRGRIDVLTAGFPCQPFSVAGQRKGAEDNRYLWPEVVRVIREVRPTWVVGENVAGILTMVQPGEETEMGGQTNIFGEVDRKRVLLKQEYVVKTICGDLEREGYSVQPFIIPACAIGAPHRRDRVWFVANSKCDRGDKICENVQFRISNGKRIDSYGMQRNDIADTNSKQLENTMRSWTRKSKFTNIYIQRTWQDFPSQSPVCSGDDGLSTQLDGITFSKWRQESIKAYGNAWVPAVAYEIFETIQIVTNELLKNCFDD